MKSILVAIPVWEGDFAVVMSNLRKHPEKDGEYSCVLAYDSKLSHEKTSELEGVLRKCFVSVFSISIDVSQPRSWPRTQNMAWQTTARFIEAKYEGVSNGAWFWWESDVVPLKKGWIDALSEAYWKGKRPFMGHIVPGRGHMNGVAVYPFNISYHCTKAMLVKDSPFDVVLSSEIKGDKITDASHLISHHLKSMGGDPPKPLTESIIASLPPETILIHGYFEASHEQLTTIKTEQQEKAMNETSKAMRRRKCEEAEKDFDWSKVFTGKGVDVGAGNDPIQLPNCRAFDMMDGDANFLSRYIVKESVDYIHASQALEHMIDPRAALLNWSICLKKGGHIVATVPDFDLYEKRHWPSRFNSDHKSAWSFWRRTDKSAPIVYVPEFCDEMCKHGLECIRGRLVDTNYDYTMSDDVDQTLPQDGCEAFIEMVFKKV